MDNVSGQFSEWSSDSVGKNAGNNLFTTLSQNLMRYERQNKLNSKKPKTYRINKTHATTKNTIILTSYEKGISDDKENNLLNEDEPFINHNRFERKQKDNGQVLLVPTIPLTSCSNKQRTLSRKAKSNQQNIEQPMKTLKMRQMKFENKDKKKFKDRFVDIYTELCGAKANKYKISLKQIDDINKQSKEQKIEMFLKLLKR